MLQFLFSPNGRISRSDIWVKYFLPYVALMSFAFIFDTLPFMPRVYAGERGIAEILVSIFYIWPTIAIGAKRYHDRNMTGWWVLLSALFVLPGMASVFYGFLIGASQLASGVLSKTVAWLIFGGAAYAVAAAIPFFVIQFCLPGKAGANKYGADPLAG